MTRSTHSR